MRESRPSSRSWGCRTSSPSRAGSRTRRRSRASASPTCCESSLPTGEVSAFQYAPTRGLAGPLDALADRLERLQGNRPAEDELLITSGGIEALELIGKSYLDPGDLVVVEGPTYLGAIQAFRSFEAKLVAVSMDEQGLEVDELERLLVGGLRPKLLYTHSGSPESSRREPLR